MTTRRHNHLRGDPCDSETGATMRDAHPPLARRARRHRRLRCSATTVVLAIVAATLAVGPAASPAAAWAAPAPGYLAEVSDRTGFGCGVPDGTLIGDAQFCNIRGLGVAADGDLFVADRAAVFRVDRDTDVVTRVAGAGSYGGPSGFSGDGGPATDAQLNYPFGVVEDAVGNLFIADRDNGRIRRVDAATGIITTVVGTGETTFNGDGLLGTATNVDPLELDIAADGGLVFSDWFNNRVRRWDPVTGLVSTIAGTGVAGFGGDGGPATAALVKNPGSVAFDAAGNLLITEEQRIRRVDASTGFISTIAGTGVAGFSGDGGPATAAMLFNPSGVRSDAGGNIYFSDAANLRIRRIDTHGIISTIAGGGSGCCDGMLGTDAYVGNTGLGLVIDSAGNVVFTAFGLRQLLAVAPPAVGALSGVATGPGGGPADGVVVVAYSADALWQARGHAVTGSDGTFTIPGLAAGGYRVRVVDFEGRFRNEWANAKLTQPTGDVIQVPSGGTGSVALGLVARPPGALVGKVTTGDPAVAKPGVLVLVVDDTGLVALGVTNASGGYWIGGITAGTYGIAYWDLSNPTVVQWYPEAPRYNDPARVDLIIGDGVTTADAHLP